MADRELSDTGDAATMAGIEALGDTSGTINVRKAFSDTTTVDFNVSNTNLTVNVNVGFRHTGAVYDGTKYRLEKTSGSTFHTVSGTTANITWEYCQFVSSGTHSSVAIGHTGSGTVKYYSCIGWDSGGAGNPPFYTNAPGGTTYYFDCLGYSALANANHGVFHRNGNGTVYCYRCTGSRVAASGAPVFRTDNVATMECYGCIAHTSGGATSCYSNMNNGDYNISETTDAPGANSWNSVNVDALIGGASTDYSIPAANYITFTGTYVTPDYSATAGSKDIAGTTRVSTGLLTPGCDQCIPAAPTVDATPAPDASYTVGSAYSVDHAATGEGTLTFDVSAGAIPSGTTLTGATGVVAGTLDTVESVSYTLRVTDAWGQTGTREFTTEVVAAAVVGGDDDDTLALNLGLGL